VRKGSIIISLVLLALSVFSYFYVIPTQIITSIPIEKNTPAVLHPDFFPRLTIFILAIVSISLLVSSIRYKTNEKTYGSDYKSAISRVVIVFLLSYSYVLSLKYVGYALSTPVFMAIIIILLGLRNWRLVIPTSIAFPFALNIFFWYSFKVVLPEGDFEISTLNKIIIGLILLSGFTFSLILLEKKNDVKSVRNT
tara:strand:+ start:151 stop:735 length:585 start_codon:yes stop_codon:yes gene_type:complete